MNLGQIVKRIRRKLQDPAILETDIIDEVNAVLLGVAAEISLPPLIQLDQTVTVLAGNRSVSMPDDFHHDLLGCRIVANGDFPTIRASTSTLYRDYDDNESSTTIDEVALAGNVLHVTPKVSEDVELAVSYYGKPDTLVNDSDEPAGIPDHLQNDILVSGTLIEFLPESSDELPVKESRKSYHIQRHVIGRDRLKLFYQNAPRQRNVLIRTQRDF